MYYNRVPMLDDNEFWPFCGAAEWTTWMEMNMVPKE
jgi:hypothetical protein